MNLESVEKQLNDWILNFLAVPSSSFNNLAICPYAKQAWLTDKVLVVEDLDANNISELLQTYEVIVQVFDSCELSPEQLYDMSQTLTNEHVVALDDHPEAEEKVDDINLNNGVYALLLIQSRKKLEQARAILEQKGYYEKWDPEYLAEVRGV